MSKFPVPSAAPSKCLSSDEKSSWIHLWTRNDMSSPENILCKLLETPGDLLWKMKVWKGTPISSLNQHNEILMWIKFCAKKLFLYVSFRNLNINENGFVSFQPPHTFRRRTRCSKLPFLRTFFVTDSNLQQQSRSRRNLHNCCRIIDVCQFTRIFTRVSVWFCLWCLDAKIPHLTLDCGNISRINTSCGHSEQQTKPQSTRHGRSLHHTAYSDPSLWILNMHWRFASFRPGISQKVLQRTSSNSTHLFPSFPAICFS